MTLLTICQDAANEIGVPSPNTVVGSTDTTVIQLLAAANREDQGAMTSIATDFLRFSNDTMWNRTTNRKFYGPLNNTEWQTLKGIVVNGVTNYFRIRGNKLLLNPTPTAGQKLFFEYIQKNWVDTTGDGSANATSYAADSNTTILDEDLITLGVIWRFLKQKGLPYDNQLQEYQIIVR